MSGSRSVRVALVTLAVLAHGGAALNAPKVVVTGLGALTGVGNTYRSTWEAVNAGKTGVATISCFDEPERFPSTVGCEVRDFVAKDHFGNPKNAKSNDRYTHLAVAAARQALADAGLEIDASASGAVHPDRVGVMIGSAFGGIGTVEAQAEQMRTRGPRRVSPFAIPALLGNTASGVVAIEVDARGPNFGVVSACASGTHAIGEAQLAIQRGDADVVVCGGAEASMTPLMYGGFCAMKAMCAAFNDDPQRASRPFDARRAGFVMGEGAGVVVLERAGHALKRGARIYAELAGYGATCDAHHITTPAPGGAGLARCLGVALGHADVAPAQVDYVDAGAAEKQNLDTQLERARTVFGSFAALLQDLREVSGTRSLPPQIRSRYRPRGEHFGFRAGQRARHVDGLQRPVRDRGAKIRLRRRDRAADVVDQGRDGPHHGRRRRHRGRADVFSGEAWRLPAHHKPRDAGPGLRPELCFRRRGAALGGRGDHAEPGVWRAQRRAGLQEGLTIS